MRFVRCSIILALTAGVATGTLAAQAPEKPAARTPASNQVASGGARIAFINVAPLLKGMPGYAQAESTWTREATLANAEAQKLRAVFDSAVATYQQGQATMTPPDRAAREKQLQASQDSLQGRLQELQDRVQNRRRDLLGPIEERLKAIIDGVRAEGNYVMIIDLGSNASANIVSYDKSMDLTLQVATRLAQSN